jgi:hypothetical protein
MLEQISVMAFVEWAWAEISGVLGSCWTEVKRVEYQTIVARDDENSGRV